jgi:hypothetical protein
MRNLCPDLRFDFASQNTQSTAAFWQSRGVNSGHFYIERGADFSAAAALNR